ncbi:L-type lectin-domain containing receptor kinase IX.1-like protein, partial [Tanacetum coccineum]
MQVRFNLLLSLQTEWSRFVTVSSRDRKIDRSDITKAVCCYEINTIRHKTSRANDTNHTCNLLPHGPSASTRHKGQRVANKLSLILQSVYEEDSDPEQARRDKDMEKDWHFLAKYFKNLYKPTNNTTFEFFNSRNRLKIPHQRYKKTIISQGSLGIKKDDGQLLGLGKPKWVKDYAYHKEKMMMCKQVEQGVSLQAEQADWLEDTDEEIDEQELEAHYSSHRQRFKEVSPAESSSNEYDMGTGICHDQMGLLRRRPQSHSFLGLVQFCDADLGLLSGNLYVYESSSGNDLLIALPTKDGVWQIDWLYDLYFDYITALLSKMKEVGWNDYTLKLIYVARITLFVCEMSKQKKLFKTIAVPSPKGRVQEIEGVDFEDHLHSCSLGKQFGFLLPTRHTSPFPIYQMDVKMAYLNGQLKEEVYVAKVGRDSGFELTAFSDADHAGCLDTRKSTLEGYSYLAEAGYIAVILQVVLSNVDEDHNFKIMASTTTKYRCTATLSQALRKYLMQTPYIIREQSSYHTDYLFTKALPEDRFKYLVRRIGMRCLTPAELEAFKNDEVFVMDKGSKERSPPHNLRQKPGQYICCQNHKLIADIENDIMDPAPYLLLYLGGPDSIIAFALADNELWLRHLLGLLVQTDSTIYITLLAWNNILVSFLTIPMLLCGIIKYGERTWVLMSANRDQFRDSVLTDRDPSPSYAKFIEELCLKDAEGRACAFLWMRKKKTREVEAKETGFDIEMDNEFEMGIMPNRFTYHELARATGDFVENEKLGEGGYGGVYRGFMKDSKMFIAVKRVSKSSKHGIKEYVSKVKIVSRLRHRNQVQLELILTYEYMEIGSLDSHLFKA